MTRSLLLAALAMGLLMCATSGTLLVLLEAERDERFVVVSE